MKMVLMNLSQALAKGIVSEPIFQRHNKEIVLVQDQDLICKGYDLHSLPAEFQAEILSVKETKERIKRIKDLC